MMLALSGQADAQASGYTGLITLFEKMKGEATTEKDTKSGELENKTEHCAEAIEDMNDNIKTYQDTANEQEKQKESEEEAKAGAEADLADTLKKKQAAMDGLTAAENQYQTDSTRRAYDIGQLNGAVSGLDAATKSVGENQKFTASTKTTLTQKLQDLKTKINNDLLELQGVHDNAPTRHQKIVDDFNAEITRLGNEETTLNADIATHSTKIGDAKRALAAARDNLNKEMSAKTKKSNLCANEKNTLEEEIEDATVRVSALTKALDILGEGPASTDQGETGSFVQLKAIREVSSGLRFLQSRASDPKKPLLDLISKWGQTSIAAKFLTRLMSQDTKAEAFSKVKEEITMLYDTMVGQQKEDAKSQNWCQKKDDKLTLQIEDLTTALANLNSEKDAASTQSSHHKSESDKAKGALVQLTETSVADAKELEQDVKDNTLTHTQLVDDLEAVKQAKITMTNAFKGRTNDAGVEILQIIEEVIGDYQKAIRVAKDVARALQAEKQQQEDAFESQSGVQKGLAKKHLTSHEKYAGDVMHLEDQLRYATRELEMAKETFKKIFTSKDGKCHKYNEVYPSRIADRKVEMENLHSAQEALNSYMESLGIRVQ